MINDVIIFSTADWDTNPWTNKQHVAIGLAKRGYRVLYVDSTGIRSPGANKADWKRIWRRLKAGFCGTKMVADNVFRCSPLLIPFRFGKWIESLNHVLLFITLKIHLSRLDFKNILAWVYNPTVVAVLNRIKPQISIYHCVDDLAAIPNISHDLIRACEHKLSEIVRIVFSTNRKLDRKWKQIKPNGAYYLPNVANYEHFSRARNYKGNAPELNAIPKPRIGYIGTLSDYKVDFELIMDVALMRYDWHWVIIGGEREGQYSQNLEQLKKCSNVHFLGYKEYDTLPFYLSGIDIATLPILDNAYTQSMFPMKFFEYLSAGLPVISTPLPALLEYMNAFRVANNAEDFIEAAETILRGDVPDSSYCDQLARLHTWERRLDIMLDCIDNNIIT